MEPSVLLSMNVATMKSLMDYDELIKSEHKM